MSAPFIITGLPRSRTAWFAALCNTVPEAICYHEPLANMASWRGVAGLLNDARYQYAGASDSGLGLHLEELVRVLRQPRVLIVSRSPEDVKASLDAIMVRAETARFLEILAGRLEPMRTDPAVMVVDYDRLTHTRVVCACLRHLMPDATICPSKVVEFGRLNVQADLDRVMIEAQRAADQGRVPALLGVGIIAELLG